MKKILNKFILIIVLFTFNINVYAATKQTENRTITTSSSPSSATIEQKYAESDDQPKKHLSDYGLSITEINSQGEIVKVYDAPFTRHRSKTTTSGGGPLNLYCLDPAAGAYSELFARRFLISESSSVAQRTYDAAIMSVLTNQGYSFAADGFNVNYMPVSHAVRALTALWGLNKAGNLILAKAYFGQAYHWINGDANIENYYNILYQKIGSSSFKSLSELQQYSMYTLPDYSSNSYTLFLNAMKTAVDYLNTDTSSVVDNNVVSSSASTIRNDNENYTEVSKVLTHNFTLKNFSSDGNASFIINSVGYKENYSSDLYTPIIKEIRINNYSVYQGTDNNILGVNLLGAGYINGTFSGDLNISVDILFKAINRDDNNLICTKQPLKYLINYSYSSASSTDNFSNYIGVEWDATLVGSGDDTKQRFVSVEKNANPGNNGNTAKTIEKEFSLNLIDDCNNKNNSSCDDLVKSCLSGNASDCTKLETKNCGCESYEKICSGINNCTAYKKYNCDGSSGGGNQECNDEVAKCLNGNKASCKKVETLSCGCTNYEKICTAVNECDAYNRPSNYCDNDDKKNKCANYVSNCLKGDKASCTKVEELSCGCSSYKEICDAVNECDAYNKEANNCKPSDADKNKCDIEVEKCLKGDKEACTKVEELSCGCANYENICKTVNVCDAYNKEENHCLSGSGNVCDTYVSKCLNGDKASCTKVEELSCGCSNYKKICESVNECDAYNKEENHCYDPSDSYTCEQLLEACKIEGNLGSSKCQKLKAKCTDCDSLDYLCKLGDEESCQKYKDNPTCKAKCETTVSNEFQCCDENNDILLINPDPNETSKKIEVNGPDNVLSCFVNKVNDLKDSNNGYANIISKSEAPKDDANNSYVLSSNKYCAISCKEDYTFNLPSSKLVSSGRYFSFKMGIKGTKTCYTNTIDKSAFDTDMANIEKEMEEAYKAYQDLNDESNTTDIEKAKERITNANNAYSKIISDYNSCSTYKNEYNYKPTINYDYEEDYDYSRPNMESYSKVLVDKDNASIWACTGTINNGTYTSCNGTSSTTLPNSIKTYKYCDINGCTRRSEVIYTANYVKKTATVEDLWRPKTLFYNVYPSGNIVRSNTPVKNGVPLENKLPVSLNTKRGNYIYHINISDIGEFYSKNTLGRLIGNSNSVLKAKDLVNASGEVAYLCSYLVNQGHIEEGMLKCDLKDCDGPCDFDCIGAGCDNQCSGNNCISNCIGAGCLYDEGSTIFQKEVSLSVLFPNGTESYNWDKTNNEKAKDAIEAIESAGNAIYDAKPILSVNLNSEAARLIKSYNKARNGNYADASLDCKALNGISGIACYSNFITDIIDNKINGTTVNVVNRENSNLINTRSKTDEYFAMWPKYSSGLNSEKVMLGPSWK